MFKQRNLNKNIFKNISFSDITTVPLTTDLALLFPVEPGSAAFDKGACSNQEKINPLGESCVGLGGEIKVNITAIR